MGSRTKTLSLFWLQTCSEQRKGQHQEKQLAIPMLTSQTNLKIIRYNVHLLHIACGLWLRIFICPRQITPSPEKQSDAKLIEVLECMHRWWMAPVSTRMIIIFDFQPSLQFATFPGFSPAHPTPLPHGMLTLDQMKRVTRAQTNLAIKVTLHAMKSVINVLLLLV